MAKEVLIATSNRGKIKEFKRLLGRSVQLVTPTDAAILATHPLAPKVEEAGISYYENALTKAIHYNRVYGRAVLSDDSGVEIDALKGAPGVDSAILGGESISWAERWSYLLNELRKSGAPQPWNARFRCVLCYYDGKNVPWFSEGVCEGRILPEPLGTEGFGYDPLFFSQDLNASFGLAAEADKDLISHRSRAVQSFLKKTAQLI